jgi:serine protease Do
MEVDPMRLQNDRHEPGVPRKHIMTLGGLIVFAALVGLYLSDHVLPSHGFALAQGQGQEGADIQVLEAQNRAFERIAEQVTPAVVNIQTTQVVRVQQSPFFNDPFFRQFFGNLSPMNIPKELREHALGSGVIISPQGYIVTNNHVLARASEIQVQLADRRVFQGKVVGADPLTDVAVLQIQGKDLPTASWGESSELKVGDIVMAFGNPFGLNFTVTRGIVSAVGRSGLGIENVEDFIQTDAAINPGNSGGALVDIHGRVVGINTAIVSPGSPTGEGAFNGVGLAIPADIVRHVSESLINSGKVTRGYLGVTVSDLNQQLARQFKVPDIGGVLVQDVEAKSPADRAGIRQGDVIRDFNGKKVDSKDQFTFQITEMDPGAEVTIALLRDGRPQELRVTLGTRPENLAEAQPQEGNSGQATGPLQGISAQDLTNALRRQYGVPEQVRGVVISELDPSSAAAQNGLQVGDVIEEVDHHVVREVKDFELMVAEAKGEVLLRIDRQGSGFYMVLAPPDGEGGD